MEGQSLRVLLVPVLVVAAVGASQTGPVAVTARPGHAPSCIYDHQSLRTASGTCRPHAKSYPSDVTGKVKHAIYDSSLLFSIPYSLLLQIAKCESGLNPRAAHAGHYGLFQFLPTTFSAGATQLRRGTGVKVKSYWNPLDAAYVAGYLFVAGQINQWSCVQWPSSRR